MKAILLARVSTEDQTTEQQLPRLIEYANAKGFEYTDADIYDFKESAYKSDRKEFEKVLSRIDDENETVALIADKVDRLVRDFLQYLPRMDELRKSGKVELHFPSENLVITASSPAVDLFKLSIGVALAQYYSNSISDNVKRKFEDKIRNGELLTKAPFGYRNVPKSETEAKSRIDVEPSEAKIIQRMHDLYATNCYADRTLQKQIEKEFGVRIPKSQISRILTNKFYIGIATYHKRNLEYPHIYETILSENIFKKVQEIRDSRTEGKQKSKYGGIVADYRATIRCGICGCSISPERHRGKMYYACSNYHRTHRVKYITQEKLTELFSEAFERIQLSTTDVEKIVADLKSLNESKDNISNLRTENLREKQDRLKRMRTKNYDNYADDSITKEQYEENEQRYKEEYDNITYQLGTLEQVDNSFYVSAKLVLELAKQSKALFLQAQPLERQQLIKTTLLNITWDGENLHYDYEKPFNILANFKTDPFWVDEGT